MATTARALKAAPQASVRAIGLRRSKSARAQPIARQASPSSDACRMTSNNPAAKA
jgi:hypothetical protein